MIDDKINSHEVIHHGIFYITMLKVIQFPIWIKKGYVLDGFPSQSELNLDIQKQMHMIKNWKMQPDFIINMRVS
jgi:adenylate/nucleoside-diphosphate kinase